MCESANSILPIVHNPDLSERANEIPKHAKFPSSLQPRTSASRNQYQAYTATRLQGCKVHKARIHALSAPVYIIRGLSFQLPVPIPHPRNNGPCSSLPLLETSVTGRKLPVILPVDW